MAMRSLKEIGVGKSHFIFKKRKMNLFYKKM